MVDTIEKEISSKFDISLDSVGNRVRPLAIVKVKAKPMKPKNPIKMRRDILPYRWLTEQGHLFYQHLLQTIGLHPKKVDGQTLQEFSQTLENEVPEHVLASKEAYVLYINLHAQAAAVSADQQAQCLADTRPIALVTLKDWEAKLHIRSEKADSHDKQDAENNGESGLRIREQLV